VTHLFPIDELPELSALPPIIHLHHHHGCIIHKKFQSFNNNDGKNPSGKNTPVSEHIKSVKSISLISNPLKNVSLLYTHKYLIKLFFKDLTHPLRCESISGWLAGLATLANTHTHIHRHTHTKELSHNIS
jgi:hypothetical protein